MRRTVTSRQGHGQAYGAQVGAVAEAEAEGLDCVRSEHPSCGDAGRSVGYCRS